MDDAVDFVGSMTITFRWIRLNNKPVHEVGMFALVYETIKSCFRTSCFEIYMAKSPPAGTRDDQKLEQSDGHEV
ncbi:hypothetical protein GCM10027093_09030 [Paraburkholderia jirisanensis]